MCQINLTMLTCSFVFKVNPVALRAESLSNSTSYHSRVEAKSTFVCTLNLLQFHEAKIPNVF